MPNNQRQATTARLLCQTLSASAEAGCAGGLPGQARPDPKGFAGARSFRAVRAFRRRWLAGLACAETLRGSDFDAWLATRFAANKGAVWVRRFVIAVILLSAAQLLGVFE